MLQQLQAFPGWISRLLRGSLKDALDDHTRTRVQVCGNMKATLKRNPGDSRSNMRREEAMVELGGWKVCIQRVTETIIFSSLTGRERVQAWHDSIFW